MIRAALLSCVLVPGPWQPPVPSGAGPSPGVLQEARPPQGVLEDEAVRFARAWVDGDVRGLERMLVARGIRLHLEGDLYPDVDARRAGTTIRTLLEKYRPGEVEVIRVSESTGPTPRGFADLQWRTQVAGTGESVIFTLFVAFAMEEGGWMVTEIRILS